jgi:hypothetical protein
MAEKKSKSPQVLAAEKRRQEKQEAKNTFRRETKDATSVIGAGRYKKMYPHELGVVGNLKYQAEKGVKKAKEVGSKVVDKAKNMGAKAGKAMKMADGGMPMVKKGGKMVPAFAADGVGKMSYGGKVKKMADGKMVTKKKKTTKVSKSECSRRADGCAVRGKTKGRMV